MPQQNTSAPRANDVTALPVRPYHAEIIKLKPSNALFCSRLHYLCKKGIVYKQRQKHNSRATLPSHLNTRVL